MFHVVLPPSPRAVGVARWLIQEWCAGWVKDGDVDDDTVDSAMLLSSEVITNAVIHGEGMVHVRLNLAAGSALRIEVSDEGGGMPLIGRQRDDAESGRGMAMVELMSRRWGTDLGVGPMGKTVWFELGPA